MEQISVKQSAGIHSRPNGHVPLKEGEGGLPSVIDRAEIMGPGASEPQLIPSPRARDASEAGKVAKAGGPADPDEHVTDLNDMNFKDFIKNAPLPVVVNFYHPT
ncbi:MAG: hypothetical protein RDV48_25075 [Candidatus Eremiobacteraeota bacterium]|nr:hypothetical protein [Candidatus Eremiobacteraeota bacterium]